MSNETLPQEINAFIESYIEKNKAKSGKVYAYSIAAIDYAMEAMYHHLSPTLERKDKVIQDLRESHDTACDMLKSQRKEVSGLEQQLSEKDNRIKELEGNIIELVEWIDGNWDHVALSKKPMFDIYKIIKKRDL